VSLDLEFVCMLLFLFALLTRVEVYIDLFWFSGVAPRHLDFIFFLVHGVKKRLGSSLSAFSLQSSEKVQGDFGAHSQKIGKM
jgi:hypothetical protein